MKNNKADFRHKILSGVAKVTLLAMIFAIIFAGTLSGAFGIESLAIEQTQLDGTTSNITDTVGVADAAGATYVHKVTDLTSTFNDTSADAATKGININPYVKDGVSNLNTDADDKRNGFYTTNKNHLVNNGNITWTTGDGTNGGTWGLANNANHDGDDFVCLYFDYDLGEDYSRKVVGNMTVSLSGSLQRWDGAQSFAIESSSTPLPTPTGCDDSGNLTYPSGTSTSITSAMLWYRRVKFGTVDGTENGTKDNSITTKGEYKKDTDVTITHTILGRYIRIHYVAWDPSWDFNESRFTNVKVTLKRTLNTLDNALTGSGTQYDPFILATRTDFDLLSWFCQFFLDCTNGKYFKVQPANGSIIDFGTADFTPIGGVQPNGDADYQNYIFKGYLDGNNSILSNVKVGKDTNYNGLFGVTSNSTISNLTINTPTIGGSGTSRGAFIGRANGTTTLTNCTVSGGSVSGKYQAGGLVGYSNGAITFSGCKNNGTSVSTTGATGTQTRVGGFIGSCDNSVTISGTSSNSGAVWSSAGDDKMGIGGFVGYVNTNLNISGNLTNSGNIGADDNKYGLYTGGIAGWVKGNVSIGNGYTIKNTGKIIARAVAGGCFGYTGGGNIIRCQNTGDVIAKGRTFQFGNLSEGGATLGGIVGYANGGDISHCYSSGQLSTLKDPSNLDSDEFEGGGTNFIGGIAGYVNGNVSYCYAKNDIQGSHYIGGIVGLNYNNSHTISYCYFDGSILGLWNSGNAYVGLICGNGAAAISSDNTNLLLPNAKGITEHGAGSVNYKQQAPKIVKTDDITLLPAVKLASGAWSYLSSWTSIINNDVVGVRLYANNMTDGQYLRFNSPTQFLSDKDKFDSSTKAGESTAMFSSWGFFSSARTTGVNVQIGTIGINGTNSITYGDSCNLETGWDDIDATGKALYTATSPKWYFYGKSKNGVDNFNYTTSTVGNTPSNPPTQAGIYDMMLEVCINGVVLGRVQSDYTIAQRKLTVSAVDFANKSVAPGTFTPPYIYNASDQGLKSLTISNIIDGKSAQDLMDVVASWFSPVPFASNQYTFSGAKNASDTAYNVKITIKDKNYKLGDVDESYTSSYEWKINPKELGIDAVSHSGSKLGLNSNDTLTYNGSDQGLNTLTISNIVDSGKTSQDILNVVASWFSPIPFENNCYTFSGSKNADAYVVGLEIKDSNYILPSNLKSATYTWTIIQSVIEIEVHALGNPTTALNLDGKVYEYNTQKQGPVELCVMSGLFDNFGDVFAVSFTGGFVGSDGKTLVSELDTRGNNVYMNAINAGTYSVTVKLKTDSDIASNYTINYKYANAKSEGSTKNDTYQWTINPQTMISNWFAYDASQGVVTNSEYLDVSLTAYRIKGYRLSKVGDSAVALVYKNTDYIFSNFQVYTMLNEANLVLVGNDGTTIATPKSGKFSAYYMNGSEKVYVKDISDISLGDDHTPRTFTLTFESLDSNYVFDTTDNKDKIVYTLLVSDFGGHFDQADWGSQENPFVISTIEHLLRLSQIVNGGVAWNSIYTTDRTLCATAAEDVKVLNSITTRTYQNAFFEVRLPEGQDTLKVTQAMGFVPIGGHNVDGTAVDDSKYFSGTFYNMAEENADGTTTIKNYTIRVEQQRTDDYVGLFGILNGATIKDTNIVVNGGANNAGNTVAMSGANYVGAVAGKATDSTIINVTTGKTATMAEASWIEATGNYVGGLVGYYIVTDPQNINGYTIKDVHARSYHFEGKDYVGGVVGYTENGTINNPNASEFGDNATLPNGNNYIGGIAGVIKHTTIEELGWDEAVGDITGLFYTGGLYGKKAYVGSIAGYWEVTNGNQVNGANHLLSQGTQNISVIGDTFVGGLVGYFDASNCEGGLAITPKIGLSENATNSITVRGANYVGSLFGVFIGSGYKKTSAEYNASTDTLLLVAGNTNGTYNISATVNIQGESATKAYVIGGLVGYISNAGIAFTTDYGHISGSNGNYNPVEIKVPSESKVTEVNFIGMIAGIMGENSTIECTKPDGSNGDYSNIMLVTESSSLGNTKNDFVGRIAGYVASNAGIKNGDTGTMFGNRMIAVTAGGTNGVNFVGGLFGAIGKIGVSSNGKISNSSITIPYSDKSSNEYKLLYNALRGMKSNGDESTTTLVFAPRTQAVGESAEAYGRIANRGNVTGKDYVGGIVGAVLDNARLEFVNPQYDGKKSDGSLASASELASVYDNIYKFNGYHTYIISGGSNTTDSIVGEKYVGGIAGYLGSGAHLLQRVVSRINFTNDSATYVGGITGYMQNGTIENCMTPYTGLVTGITIDSYNVYHGASNVGGIVGYLEAGKVVDSISTGMKFDGFADSNNTVGGVVGSATQNAKVENSWAIFVSATPTYSSVPANEWGKFVVISNTIKYVPNYIELARMIGLYNFNISAVASTTNASLYKLNSENNVVSDYSAEFGELSISASVPANNQQLVFYNASGRDVVSDNTFSVFQNDNSKLYMRLKAFGDGAQNSMIVAIADVKFTNIAPFPNINYTDGNENAEQGYVKPSNSDKYSADVTNATYYTESTNKNIKSLTANIFFNGALVGTAENSQQVGHYENTFTPGSSEESPYIIASQQDWDDFAWNIYTGQNDYAGQFVKLTTDVEISKTTSHDFTSVTTPNKNSGDGKNATSNGGYNFAGNISQGGDSTLSIVTVGGTESKCTPSFKGVFDGDGHSITLNANITDQYHRISVFPNASNATFMNLTIGKVGDSINTGSTSGGGAYDLAGFVGKAIGPVAFYNCTNNISLQGFRTTSGFVGYSTSSASVSLINCVNNGDITTVERANYGSGEQPKYEYGTGGLLACVNYDITIESCINNGNITGETKVGGIIGQCDNATITINSCANTGNITANQLRSDDASVNAWAMVGGIIGSVSYTSTLNLYDSYNIGNIRGLGSIGGGLVGILGTCDDSNFSDNNRPRSTMANNKSTIARCFNTGTVILGHHIWGGISTWLIGGGGTASYPYNGTDAGGIVGNAVKVDITDCYNVGEVVSYGGAGWGGTWHAHTGGIIGEVATEGGTANVDINRCYNTGLIQVLESKDSSVRYSASIVGYIDSSGTLNEPASEENKERDRVYVSNCFAEKNCVMKWVKEGGFIGIGGTEKEAYMQGNWIDYNVGAGSANYGCVRVGTVVDSLADLTAVVDASGNVRPKNNDVKDGLNTSAWVFLPGCLPQLKVFALDSPNGLSMNAQYVSDITEERDSSTGKLKSVSPKKVTAGDLEEYPYIIRDGIGLWGLQRLVTLGNTFANKNIAFANDTNNIFGASKAIDMTTYKYSISTTGSANSTGRSYHLIQYGAVFATDPGTTSKAETYNQWNGSNYYYTTSGGLESTNGKSFTEITALYNFAPIGSDSKVFAGNITGYNADGNVVLKNLRLNVPNGTNYGGLFGYAQNAKISYITTAGNINVNGYAGGIVGQLENSTVDHCNAGTSSDVLNIVNYNTTASDNPIGGIVGFSDGNKWYITNCVASNVTLKSDKQYIGGIVGKTNGTIGKITGCEVQNVAMSTTNATDARFLGGIVGYNNADQLEIATAKVGVNGETTIPGAYALGGIIGVAWEGKSTYIHDCEVGHTLKIVRNSSMPSSQYGVAIGGIVGYSADVENGRVLTFGGKIIFNGEIIIGTAKDSNTISNIGGIIGYMGSGSVFEDGSSVSVDGKITFNSNATGTRKNIGGVAGITKNVEFIGTFNVKPKMELGSASSISNIGGFIGFNDGICAIIADDVIATLVAEGQVSAEGGTHIVIGGTIGVDGAENVGGFIGNNNHTLNIGPDEANGVRYNGQILNIEISGGITGHDNVGGFVGNNEKKAGINGGIDIKKGNIQITGGTITGRDNVGGIVGKSTDKLSTGGSIIVGISLSITNGGEVRGHDNVGGVFGYLEGANIADTFTNSGSVTASGNYAGGVIGYMKSSTIYGGKFENSGEVSATVDDSNTNIANYIGGVIGIMGVNSNITGGEFVNLGTVSGNQFVGGSIGFMSGASGEDNEAKITVQKDGDPIKFVNGSEIVPSNQEAQTAVDGVASAENGKISGNRYLGGSIGIMNGTITGMSDNKVQFDNLGMVGGYENSLVYYVGGSVAIIAGSVDYAVFSNRSKDMSVKGANIVGGSIGFIGGANSSATIKNTHFEFTGELVVENSQGGSDAQYVGIGGSIGVIKSAEWENNTFYSSGQVQASGKDSENGAENVGGSIGLIVQDGIKISNMLAYETTVIGRMNVGGVVGATQGANTVIENSFNVRGTVEGINAGGIIGLAIDGDTDASTSYWVKKEKNINLEKTDINNLNASLGKNENVKIDGKDLSDTVSSPIEYIDTKILNNQCTGVPDRTIDPDDATITRYTITTTYTLNVQFSVASQTETIQVIRKDLITYDRVVDEEGHISDTITNREMSYAYSAGGTTGNIVEDTINEADNTIIKGTNNWNALLEKTELKGKYTYTNGYYVYSTSATTYSTGKASTGWYFVYADTQQEGYINALHTDFSRKVTYERPATNEDGTPKLDGDGNQIIETRYYTFGGTSDVKENDKQAWKYIANAYTAEERTFIDSAVSTEPKSNIVKDDFSADHVYATATVGRDLYYLYMATSGKDASDKSIKPTLTKGEVKSNATDETTENGYFIDFITFLRAEGAKKTSVENIAIYYRKLQYKSSIVYNGYDRVAPITDNVKLFTDAGYDFNSFLKKDDGTQDSHIAVGTYTSNGTVNFNYTNTDSEGNTTSELLPMSGSVSFEWSITAKEITITTSGTNGGSYGDQHNITVKAEGISPNAASNGVDDIHIVIGVYSKKGSMQTFIANVVIYKEGEQYKAEVCDANLTPMNTSKLTIGDVTATNGKKFGATGSSYTSTSGVGSSTSWTDVSVELKFTDAKTYVLKYDETYDTLAGVSPKRLNNYRLTAKDASVKVEPKELTVKFLDGSPTNRMYDGIANTTSKQPMWEISGWYDNESLVTSYENNGSSKAYWEWFNIGVVYVSQDGKTTTELGKIGKSSITTSNKVIQYGAGLFKEVGNYMLQFNGMPTASSNKYTMGNYYIKLDSAKTSGIDSNKRSIAYTIGQVKIVIKEIQYDKSSGQHEYDGSTIGKATFVFEIQYDGKTQDMTQDFLNIINSYYQVDGTTKFATTSFNAKQSEKVAKATFETKTDADTYNLKLKVVASDQDKANCAPDDTASKLKATYKITQRPLNFAYSYTAGGSGTTKSYEYNAKHQGVSGITINNLVSGDTVNLAFNITNGTGWTTGTKSGYTSGSIGVTTSDVGNYTLTITGLSGKSSENYSIGAGYIGIWNITPKELSLNTVSGSAVYDGQPHEPSLTISDCVNGVFAETDIITLSYTIDGSSAGQMIDAGKYNLHYDPSQFVVKRKDGKTTGDNNGNLVDNYTMKGSEGDYEYVISVAQLTLVWSNNTLYYNGSNQGQSVTSITFGSPSQPSNVSGNSVTAYNTSYVNDALTITLTGQQTNAGSGYTMTATVGGDRAKNYNITGTTTTYEIKKAKVAIGNVSASTTTKVYDATTDYNGTLSVSSWTKVNGSYEMKSSDYTITGEYDAKDVGNRTITYTVTIKNANVECDVRTGSISGTITPAELTVELDKLRNNKATKAYDDTVYYGGANGFENGDTRSQIYRSGEGFKVSGFPNAEIAKTVKFVAKYVETTRDRSQFDKFVNDVVVNGSEYSILKDKTYYKKLVFTMSGENSGNYTFKVKIGSTEIVANGKEATIFDKDDTANKGEQNSGINIEITVKALKANYSNTAQSYANADNTYNTDWKLVEGSDATKAGLTINVVNGWMYENGVDGAPKQYEKYTVIRGREGSTVLSASIATRTDGTHINYRLSNQPILTIGYFVDTDDFPIGSMASLMIAAYYQQASSPEFNQPVIATTTWHPIVSAADYGNEGSFDSKKPADAGSCKTWDEYFAMLETSGKYVFLNTAEGTDVNGEWGYYDVTEGSGEAKKYTSFKQVANVEGILTQTDINILDNFFALYTYGEDGTVTSTTRKEWGSGKTYINNFLNVGVGNVSVVLGSIFTGDFTGTYNGNGYTINHVNIMGLTGDTNVGMFANIASTATVHDVHLRNFSIIANCANTATTYNVGGIAGQSSAVLTNCTFHGSITVNGTSTAVNVGGIVGSATANIDGAIVLGNIDVESSGKVGGVVGYANGITLDGVVSMIEILANGNVGAIVGNGSVTAPNVYYLANSAYTKGLVLATGSVGTGVSYDNLMAGSASGYLATAKTYDVIANVEIIEQDGTLPAPRESMHLKDLVKVYLLMYSQADKDNKGYLTVSDKSWLVGTADGTRGNAIVIANQQDVSLLRQFRFATFTLANNVEMYSTRPNTVFDGVFYGIVQANEHKIYVYKQGDSDSLVMFEKVIGTALPIEFK